MGQRQLGRRVESHSDGNFLGGRAALEPDVLVGLFSFFFFFCCVLT